MPIMSRIPLRVSVCAFAGFCLLPAALGQSIEVTTPGAGAAWIAGEPATVEWTSSGLPSEARVSLLIVTASDGSGCAFNGLLTVGQQQAEFTVPEWLPDAGDYTVRLWAYEADGLALLAEGNSPAFSITGSTAPLSFDVIAPGAGTVWSADPAQNPQAVQWTGSSALANSAVYASLLDGNTSMGMASPYPAPTVGEGGFAWDIPHNIGDGSGYWLFANAQVPAAGEFSIVNITPAFEIVDALPRPTIEVTGLSNGGQWQADQVGTVNWSTTGTLTGSEMVGASVSWYAGSAVPAEATGQNELCLYAWTPPGDYNAQVHLGAGGITLASATSGTVSIAAPDLPALDLTWPLGGETLDAGVDYTITWDAAIVDGVSSIDLHKGGEYCTGVAWVPTADGQADWWVPFDLEPADDYTISIRYYEWPANCGGTMAGPTQTSDPFSVRRTLISGTIRSAGGETLPRILVELRRPSSGWDESVAYALTNEDGYYEILGVPPSDYTLRAGGELDHWGMGQSAENPANEHWYRRVWDVYGFDNAQRLCESEGGYLATVTSAEENDWICQTLDFEGASFGATDREEEGVWTWVNDEPFDFDNWDDGLPDNMGGIEHYAEWYSDGTWNDIRTVRSCVCEFTNKPTPLVNYARIYYPDTPYSADAELITVEPGASLDELDFSLPEGSSIQGWAHDAVTGEPVVNIDVNAWSSQWGPGSTVGFEACTNADGFYEIRHLPSGTYFAHIPTPNLDSGLPGYVMTTYDNMPCPSDGDLIVIDVPQVVTGIDFDLEDGATISGQVSVANVGVEGVDVSASGIACGWHRTGRTDGSGDYIIRGIPEDSYAVFVHPSEEDWYAWQAFNEQACLDLANRLQVYPGMQISGIDFELTEAGIVTGTVRDEQTGDPLPGTRVLFYWWDGLDECRVELVRFADANGEYSAHLLSGEYLFVAERQGYHNEYYDGVFDPETATPITVVAGATIPEVDFHLNRTYHVAGDVRDSLTLEPLSGVSLCVFPVPVNPELGGCSVSINGVFTVAGLMDADYELIASADGYYDTIMPLTIDGDDVNDVLVELDPRPVADFDGDTDVDLDDFDLLESCLAGPGHGYLSDECHWPDLDDDLDVDLADFARFQRCYSGSGIPAEPHCEE